MGRPKEPTDTPAANENLLYLLQELERAVATGKVQWSAGLLGMTRQRLDQLSAQIRRTAATPRGAVARSTRREMETGAGGARSDQRPRRVGS
jgi:hypothetical protein